ncbi:DUF721 domain-containing protein [Paracoccus sp. Z118]|uniref:DUF721 domain-containing protein n=1 Tax=Paracoccus sp. Z118 TaxID=2851017 RepID=UPI0020B8DE85|nr:DUF721 domain-containing protein [Paracoccus sp. Z118]
MVRSARKRRTDPDAPPRRRMRGFEPAAALVAERVRAGAEGRGFAVTRLLTNWPEIVGEDIARCTRPVKISHGKGFGGTLTLLTTGPQAPLVQMQLPAIRDRVNACYGFNAVARITVTQTAPQGFAEGHAVFTPAPRSAAAPAPSPERLAEAEALADHFTDPDLSQAMRRLALNILSRRDANHRKANP